jgi:hypothetical protein
LLLLFFLLFFWIREKNWKEINRKDGKRKFKIIKAMLFLLTSLYVPVTRNCLDVLFCSPTYAYSKWECYEVLKDKTTSASPSREFFASPLEIKAQNSCVDHYEYLPYSALYPVASTTNTNSGKRRRQLSNSSSDPSIDAAQQLERCSKCNKKGSFHGGKSPINGRCEYFCSTELNDYLCGIGPVHRSSGMNCGKLHKKMFFSFKQQDNVKYSSKQFF